MMDEDKRKEIQDINREIAVANGMYVDLIEKVDQIGKRIFEVKKEVDNLENGE